MRKNHLSVGRHLCDNFCLCLQRMIGCSIISALMQEYAVTVKSTDVGLTWETHFKAKKQFEVNIDIYLAFIEIRFF